MTGQEIITQFNELVNDELNTTLVYQLLNIAKNEIEAERNWEILKRKQTFTSQTLTLPSDFADLIQVRSAYYKWSKVDMTESEALVGNSFYIDLYNNQIVLSQSPTDTMYLYYKASSPDITSDTEWVFPERFHFVLPYKMAIIYYAKDAGEKSRAWDDRWSLFYEKGMNKLYIWDDKLKINDKYNYCSDKAICEN